MTIYDDKIDMTTRSLRGVISGKEDEINKIYSIIEGLDIIKKDGDNNPIDKYTGTVMTDSRRQEIYDTCIQKAESILNDE